MVHPTADTQAPDETRDRPTARSDEAAERGGVLAHTLVSSTTPHHRRVGEHVDRYLIIEKIGQGAMGVVYSAYDPQLDRRVALKLVLGATPDWSSTQRLLREAQALARLSHPNVVSVHDAGVVDGQLFIAMEYVEGQTLTQWGAAERSLEERLEVLRSAGRGLAAAHEAGLLHRDFKPDNVMVGVDGRVYVMDFGLVRTNLPSDNRPKLSASHGDPLHPAHAPRQDALSINLTQTGSMMGTPAYMSPEQFTGVVDARSDQFSFFVVVYESIFGRRPYQAETIAELAQLVSGEGELRLPVHPDVSSTLRETILRGLASVPEERFANMDAALDELSVDRGRGRAQWSFALGIASLIGAVGLAGLLSFAPSDAPEDPCAAAAEAAKRAWDDEARGTLRSSFAEIGVPFAVPAAEKAVEALDAAGQSHARIRREICEATRVEATQSEALLDVRMDCLDDRRRRFESLIAVLSDATVEIAANALDAIADLPPAEECAEYGLTEQQTPYRPDQADEVERLRDVIARSFAMNSTGEPVRAIELLEAEAEAVARVDYLPLYGEFYAILGRAQFGTTAEGAADSLVRALSYSLQNGDERISFESSLLLTSLALLRDDRQGATHWLMLAESFLALLGNRPRDVVMLTQTRAVYAESVGRLRESREHSERALALQRSLGRGNEVQLAKLLLDAGADAIRAGDLDVAEQHMKQAHAINLAFFGPEHPGLNQSLRGLARIASGRGDYEQAIALHEQAISALEHAYGERSVALVSSYSDFTTSLIEAGLVERSQYYLKRALEVIEGKPQFAEIHRKLLINYGARMWFAGHYEAALPIQEKVLRLGRARGVGDYDAGIAEGNLASTLASLGRHEESLELHRSALAHFEAALAPDDPAIAIALFDHTVPLIALGRREEAIELLDRAESIHLKRGKDAQPSPLAEIRVVLVELLRPASNKSNRARAELLAAQVREVAPALGPTGDTFSRRIDAALR